MREPPSSFADAFYRWLLRLRWPLLLLLLGAAAWMGHAVTGLKLAGKSTDLFPSGHPYVQTFEQYGDRFGNANRIALMLVVKEGTLFTPSRLAKIQRIHRAIERLPGLNKNQLISIASRKAKIARQTPNGIEASFLMWPEVPKSQREADEVRDSVLASSFLLGPLVSKDLKATLVVGEFFEHNLAPKNVYQSLRAIIERERDANTSIHVVGRPVLLGDIEAQASSLGPVIAASVALMLAALFFYFRNLSGVIVPGAAALMSAAMGLGMLGMLHSSFDPLSVVVPFVITARALSHSAQVTIRFLEERERGFSPVECGRRSARALFQPGALAIFTDVVAALLIMLAPIPFLHKLALMSAFWLASIFLSGMVLSPLLLSVLPEFMHTGWRGGRRRAWLTRLANVARPRQRRYVFLSFGALAVLGFLGMRTVVIGDVYAGTPLLWPDAEYNLDTRQIAEHFLGTEQLNVVVEGDKPEASKEVAVVQAIEAFQRHMEALPDVGATSSIVDILPSMVALFYRGYPKAELIPDDPRSLGFFLAFLYTSGDPGDRDHFMTPNHKDANISIFLRDHRGDTLRRVVSHARAFIDSHPVPGATFRLATGYAGLLAALNEDIARLDVRITLLVFACIFACCALAYRSLMAGILFVTPLVLANLMTYALMGTLKIGLDVNTLPVVALGVGLGVDYALYVVAAIREAFLATGDAERAVRQGLSTSGRGVVVTGLTMALGVLPFWFSFLRFQAEMGAMLLFWLMISMASAVVLVPSLLARFVPRFVFQSTRKAVSPGVTSA